MRARHDDADDPAQESALSRADFDPDAVRQAVRQLILRGETTLQGDSITLTARLVSFWHGDAVLDIRVTGPGFARSDLTRVTRRRSPADEGVFAEYIRSAARE